jgi:hypothetical protein
MTLFVVPVVYAYMDRLSEWIVGRRRRREAELEAAQVG